LRYLILVEADLKNNSVALFVVRVSGSGAIGRICGGIGSGIGLGISGGSCSCSCSCSCTSTSTGDTSQIIGHKGLPLCGRHPKVCMDFIPVWKRHNGQANLLRQTVTPLRILHPSSRTSARMVAKGAAS
jgi:hypothetical protein